MYQTYYQINKNLSNAIINLMGEVSNPVGDIEQIHFTMMVDRVVRLNKEEIRKFVSQNQADLYEEEVSEFINYTKLKPFQVYKRGTNETPKSYLNLEEIMKVLTEITMLANNMLNAEEE